MNNDSQPLLGELDKARLAALIEANKLLNGTLDRDEVLRRLMALAARGANADRATLYLVDESRRELRSIVALGDGDRLREIRLPLELGKEEGLAGYVARTGETVNVADVYADPRFSRRIDDETGYRTRTVLAVPLRDPQGRVGGVVQVLNRRQGLFSEEDERYLLALAEHAERPPNASDCHFCIASTAIGSRFLPGYRAIPARSGEGIAAVDIAPCPAVDG